MMRKAMSMFEEEKIDEKKLKIMTLKILNLEIENLKTKEKPREQMVNEIISKIKNELKKNY